MKDSCLFTSDIVLSLAGPSALWSDAIVKTAVGEVGTRPKKWHAKQETYNMQQ